MEKLIIVLVATGVGMTAERSPKQLFYTNPFIYNVNSISNNKLASPNQQPFTSGGGGGSLVPYSNVYPFYSLWNNFAGTSNPSTLSGVNVPVSNQVSQIPEYHPPSVSNIHLQPYVGIGNSHSAQNGNQIINPTLTNGNNLKQSGPYHSSPLHQYFQYQVPLSSSYQTYQNLWNFDINNLRQKSVYSSQTGIPLGSSNTNDFGWNLPLKSYDDIRNDATTTGGNQILSDVPFGYGQGVSAVKGFQRGQVESFPSKQIGSNIQVEHDHNNAGGFSRGHIEAKPSITKNSAADLRNAGQDYKIGFIRGAVEHSFQSHNEARPVNSNALKMTRYDASSPKVVCYFASWSYYRKGKGSFLPENADPSLCTHIIYAFANLDKSKFAIKESDPQVDNDQQFYQRATALKERNPSLKVLLAIGGWSDSGDDKYSVLAHSPQGRRTFARETMKFLKDRNFDGLSVDWHYPHCWQSQCGAGPKSDREAFSELIKELKSVFEPEGLLVSATLSGYKEVIEVAYDIPSLSQYLDLMNVMAYDYHGAWESRTGHLAPLFMGPPAFDSIPQYNLNYTMEYFVSKGADRSKLILGVPMYGQSFQLSNPGDSSYGSEAVGPGIPGEYTQQPGMLSFYEICKRVKDTQWNVRKDLTGSWGPYAYKGNQWVGYDDSDFLARKARFVKAQRYGGMFVWTMDLDDFQNECCMGSQPLLRTISKELLGTSYDPNKVDCTPPNVPKPPVNISTTARPTPGGTQPTTEHIHHSTNTWWPQSSTTPTPTFKPQPPTPGPTQGIGVSTTTTGSVTSPSSPHTHSPSTLPQATEASVQSTTVVLVCQHANGSHSRPVPVTTAPGQSPTPKPDQPSEEGCDDTWIYKPDPMDCTSYYQCNGGRVSKNKCPSQLHWNQYAHVCDWPSAADCGSSTTQTPTTRPTTTTTMPTTTTTTQRPWPPSTQQSTPSTWATYPTNPTPSSTTYPTRPTTAYPSNQVCTSGEYSPGPKCDQYYLCNDGMKTLQSCGPGLHWNKDKKLCDWPNSANCQSGQEEKLPIRQQGPCREGEFSGSDQDCEVYYICNHGKQVQFRCQGGLHWNQNAKLCDWPASAGCHASGGGGGQQTTSELPIYTDSTSTYRPTPRPTTTTRPGTSGTTRPPSVIEPDPGSNSGDYKIVCYFTNWAWYRTGNGKYKPENIDPNLCTHIVYGFAVLDYSDLIIKPHDTWADYDNHFYEQVTAFKSRGTKVTLAIGGWNDSAGDKYSRLVNSPAARKRFITNVVEFLKKHNFDGLDLDWEYPKCWQVECDKGPDSDRTNFAAFVRELKEAFRPHGLLLSAAVSPSKVVIEKGYDVPIISRYLDWIAVMTYDFHGQWDKKTGHVAPLYFHEEDDFYYFNSNYSINYWIQQGADRKKIVMGMPLYGQSFTLANENENGLNAPTIGGGTAGEFTRASGFLAYYEICRHIKQDGWKVVQDPTGAIGPYAYKGNQWVSFDDVEMIRRKSQLIRDLDLGGGMIWALDLDDFRNTCGQGSYPLLTTIKNVLGRPKSSSDMKIKPSDQKQTTTTTTKPTTMKPRTSPKPITTTSETIAAVIVEAPDSSYPQPSYPPPSYPQPGNKDGDPCRDQPFKPHETDCSKYYVCVFGNYIENQCGAGTYWNKDHCDWTCGSDQGGGSGGTTARPVQTTSMTTYRPTTSRPTSTQSWMTTTKPSTSTSWEWKPPIVTTTTINPIDFPDTEYMVVCYFTNWAWYRQGIGKYKPEDIDYNLCTHIAYGFAVLNPTTLEIKTHDSWADIDNSFYTLVTDIKSKGKKVVIAIGGWNDSAGDKYSRLVKDAAARRKFIKNVIEFIQKWNFDGLDLDWEYPKCWQTDCKQGPDTDKADFATFVRELKEAFTPYGYLLSSAVSPSKTIIDQGYDVPTVSRYLDWIAVMTYDYHGQWDKKTGHVAPMFNHEESDNFYFNSNYTINYWINQGADRKKIVMGMPMYGQSFTLADNSNHGLNAPSRGGGTAGDFTRANGFLAYYEICKHVKSGWTVVQDESGAIGPYAYRGDQWVSYDDINMIRRKSQYIKDMGLGGGMIWALDLDDFRNVCGCEKHPLLKTINRVLRNYPEPDPKCNM